MRVCRFSLILLALNINAQELEYKLLEQHKIDLDLDGTEDLIRLSTIKEWNDPGTIHKVEIELSNQGLKLIEDTESAYEGYFKKRYDREINDVNNLADSELIIVQKTKDASYLILTGYIFASTPGILSIYRIDNNSFKRVYHDNFEPHRMIAKDYYVSLLGKKWYEAISGRIIGDYEERFYAPYIAYKIGASSIFDSELTSSYNHHNYVDFIGIENTYNIAVLYNRELNHHKFHFKEYREYPETTLRKLKRSELEKYSVAELRIIRNEIFADRGYIFKSEDLNEYFNSKSWYKPTTDLDIKLTEIEKANVELIREVEQSKKRG